MKRKLLALLLSLTMLLSLSGCGDIALLLLEELAREAASGEYASESYTSPVYSAQIPSLPDVPSSPVVETDDTWAIYWYLCGSDLESNYAAATMDLQELMKAKLPENVQVVIQTGGAKKWNNNVVDASKLQRYVYDSEGLKRIEELKRANMGKSETLEDFLLFCEENYPADKTMFLFWNHGGGSVDGAAFDENYSFDSLTLDEMYAAFDGVYTLSESSPPFEVVGFDTCLMGTIDTAHTFSDIAKYLVASEELEPGNGWYYTGFMNALARDPSMDGEALGKAICDSYVQGCRSAGTSEEITLSVTDLKKAQPLFVAYNNLGKEALNLACKNTKFFSKFGRIASRCENYGGNTPQEGYTNMVDLGHLVRSSTQLLPDNAQTVLKCLEDCVVYKVNGPYRAESTGLSCYYSYNGSKTDYQGYTRVGASEAFKYLYEYELSGKLSKDGMSYVKDLGYDELPEVLGVADYGLEDFPLALSDDGYAELQVGPEVAALLKNVFWQLCYVDDDGLLLLLGRDNDLEADWENGIFLDNFRGVWGTIDGNLCYMDITYEGADYNLYTVPVLLNGQEYNIRVSYSYDTEEYTILGARKAIDDTGAADKNLVQLAPGDEISPIHYIMSMEEGQDQVQRAVMNTFTVTENTSFYERDLGDGTFMLMFEMIDIDNDSFLSDAVVITVEGEDVYLELLE